MQKKKLILASVSKFQFALTKIKLDYKNDQFVWKNEAGDTISKEDYKKVVFNKKGVRISDKAWKKLKELSENHNNDQQLASADKKSIRRTIPARGSKGKGSRGRASNGMVDYRGSRGRKCRSSKGMVNHIGSRGSKGKGGRGQQRRSQQ